MEHYVSADYTLLMDSGYLVSLLTLYEKEALAFAATTTDVFHSVHFPRHAFKFYCLDPTDLELLGVLSGLTHLQFHTSSLRL